MLRQACEHPVEELEMLLQPSTGVDAEVVRIARYTRQPCQCIIHHPLPRCRRILQPHRHPVPLIQALGAPERSLVAIRLPNGQLVEASPCIEEAEHVGVAQLRQQLINHRRRICVCLRHQVQRPVIPAHPDAHPRTRLVLLRRRDRRESVWRLTLPYHARLQQLLAPLIHVVPLVTAQPVLALPDGLVIRGRDSELPEPHS